MFKRTFASFISSLGIFSFVVLLGLLFAPNVYQSIPLKFLYVGAVLSLVVSLWWAFFHGKKLSYKKLWLCRATSILLSSLTVCILTLAWNIVEISSPEKRLVFFLGTLIGNAIITSVLYFIADRIEKNTLKKMNTTFEKNVEE